MADARQSINSQKLDLILKRLDGQPTTDEWHDLIDAWGKSIERLDTVIRRVDKLHETIEGNGKPGMKTDVHDLKKNMSIISRITWMVVGTFVTGIVGLFIYLAQSHPIP